MYRFALLAYHRSCLLHGRSRVAVGRAQRGADERFRSWECRLCRTGKLGAVARLRNEGALDVADAARRALLGRIRLDVARERSVCLARATDSSDKDFVRVDAKRLRLALPMLRRFGGPRVG